MSSEKHNGSAVANTFKAYGLNISSCIHIPGMLPASGVADVTVVYGNVPQDLPAANRNGVCYKAMPGQLLLKVEQVARFLVRSGNEIVIDRHPDTSDDDVQLFLLGPAFAALLHQRGILALHGSTVQVDDGCVVFLGRCGTGKSTLATELARRGYASLGDDVCAVSIGEDGVPYAAPAYPLARLWLDSLHHFGIDPKGLRRIRPSREKRVLPVENFSCAERVPIKRLYVLSRPTNEPNLTVRPMTGPPRIMVLRDYTYRVEFLEGLNLTRQHFKQIVYLASRVPIVRVFSSRREFLVEQLANVIEDGFFDEADQLGGIVSQVR